VETEFMFHFEEREWFPPLGYVGRVTQEGIQLEHGCRVETTEDRFSDGVWDAPFVENPDEEAYIFGSVGVLKNGRLELMSSQAPIDRVFIADGSGSQIVFSNSLPLILNALDDDLDPSHLYYRSEMMAVEASVRYAPRFIRLLSGRRLRILWNEVARVEPAGVSVRLRSPERPFADYAEYREFLSRRVKSVVSNAEDADRTDPFRPLPTISAGYDSSVVAVLAAEAGVNEALTMLRYADSPSGDVLVDYPAAVAATVGLDLIDVERDRWRGSGDLAEASIAAACVSFMDVVMLTLSDSLPGSLLMVGHSGDSLWSHGNPAAFADIVQGAGQISGRGLAEHRLGEGYVLFPLPFAGLTAHPSIRAITISQEMAPWSVGGPYDRPIARRIVEEAGVRRGDFAVRKYAGSARVGSSRTSYVGKTRGERTEELLEVMAPMAITSFLEFVERLEAQGKGPRSLSVRGHMKLSAGTVWLYQKLEALNHRVATMGSRYGVKAALPRWVMTRAARRMKVRLDYTYLWPHWGVTVLRHRYRPTSAAKC
jgi:hypothetical protein